MKPTEAQGADGRLEPLVGRLNEQENLMVDRSDAADAKRFRWLLSGNGYFMEEEMLCGYAPCDDSEQDKARAKIDLAMKDDSATPTAQVEVRARSAAE